MIELFYISNDIEEIKIIDECHIDWLFIDLEIKKKKNRQKNRNTFITTHSMNDIIEISKILNYSKLLVRCNPIGSWSKTEINKLNDFDNIKMIMLPYFKTVNEVSYFLELVDKILPNSKLNLLSFLFSFNLVSKINILFSLLLLNFFSSFSLRLYIFENI